MRHRKGLSSRECLGGLQHPIPHIRIPAIDPLSPKNLPLATAQVHGTLARFGIDPNRPLLVQVSRFDPWKDPIGVLHLYHRVKMALPELQLVLAGSFANDDPEGPGLFEETRRLAGSDPDAHILSNADDVGAWEINALQRAATVAVQKSVREGFGLTVCEASWKGRPIVARPVGGIRHQIVDGYTGYFADTEEEFAERALFLFRNAEARERLGKQGRERVRQNFLLPRFIEDYLGILGSQI